MGIRKYQQILLLRKICNTHKVYLLNVLLRRLYKTVSFSLAFANVKQKDAVVFKQRNYIPT